MKFAHNAKSIKQHVKENIFLKDLDENIVGHTLMCMCHKFDLSGAACGDGEDNFL
jgi:hypothetical protein